MERQSAAFEMANTASMLADAQIDSAAGSHAHAGASRHTANAATARARPAARGEPPRT